MYEESKEIVETIWKIWDILNDKEIINKVLLNTPLIDILSNLEISQNNISQTQDDKQIILILEDIKYESHLKIITYRIESPLIRNKQNNDKSSENNSLLLNNTNESNNEKPITNDSNKYYIKLIMTKEKYFSNIQNRSMEIRNKIKWSI